MSTPIHGGTARAAYSDVSAARRSGHSVLLLARSLFDGIRARVRLMVAEAKLRNLDDRMLKDIGLERSEISSVLRDLSGHRVSRRHHNRYGGHP